MATLQSARQSSSFIAKARLKQVCQHPVESKLTLAAGMQEETEEFAPSYNTPVAAKFSASSPAARLPELDQRQLLLQTVAIYHGWHLVSLQHRHESGVLIAYLVRNREDGDPTQAIREGRALQIIMDAVGDMKVQHPRRKAQLSWLRRAGRAFGLLSA